MKIRMNVQMSGTRNGQRWPAVGETAGIPTGEATHLVASGIAEQVLDEPVTEPEPVTEIATAPEAEATTPPAAEATAPAPVTKRASPKPRKTAASKASTKE